MSLVQCDQYEPFWAKHRDDWRPCTPADVWGLREDRTFQPPSKAHLKRIARPRPEVTPLRERPPIAQRRRRELAQAQSVALSLPWNKPYVAEPLPYVRPEPVVGPPKRHPDHDALRAAQRLAEAVRYASYGMGGTGILHHMRDAVRTYRSI